jgi:hypothetical protein
MPRLLSFAFCVSLAACTSVKQEFHNVDAEEIGVVIGYEIVGSKSLDPKLGLVGDVAGILAGGGAGLVLLTAPETLNAVLRTNDPVTMVDELNTAIYERLEARLMAQGYKVRLLKRAPIHYESWRSDDVPAGYLPRIEEKYQLSDSDLLASGADAVLFVEYRVDANIKDMEELQSMNAIDLKVDEVQRSALAFSMPPHNKLLYRQSYTDSALWNRLSFEHTLSIVTSLEDWPARKR